MASARFIQVILPLKLDWEPYYRVPEGLDVKLGSRVRVVFANAFYVGCVSEVDVTPSLDPAKILPVEGLEENLPSITPEEIRFWRQLALYYLCTVGEVYKAAYPSATNHKSKLAIPESVPPEGQFQLTAAQQKAADSIQKAFQQGKTVLLKGVSGSGKTEIAFKLALDTLRVGKSALILTPDTKSLEGRFPSALLFSSGLSAARRKVVAEKLRIGEPCLVLGTRAALFLPFRSLGLIVVDSEHDSSYKQDAPAPRYHARESAIMLAGVHGANVLLSSATPSLESAYNALCGRFQLIELTERFHKGQAEVEIIDTGAEWRKRGMAGSFSFKLIDRIRETLAAGGQVLLLGPRRAYAQGRKMEEEVLEYFPEARIAILDMGPVDGEYDIYIGTAFATRSFAPANLRLVGLVIGDSMLARQDFRADEHALQLMEQFRGRCERFVIQTREPRHPVFTHLNGDYVAAMLEERRIAGYPPFTRMVKVQLKDKNEQRRNYLAKELAAALGREGLKLEGPYSLEQETAELRILLARDKSLVQKKAAMAKTITAFETSRKYTGHIIIDVDPV